MTPIDYQYVGGNAAVFVYAVYGLCFVFPFLVLFGFFEIREGDTYRFRLKRFLVMVICLIIVNLAAALAVDYGMSGLTTGASVLADPVVIADHTLAEYQIRSETAFFPEVLDDKKALCYRAAFSNYVEDQWKKYFYEESCKAERHVCADNEDDHYKGLLKTFDAQNFMIDLYAMGIDLQTIWPTAADMGTLLNRISRQPESNGHIPDPPDDKMLAEYQYYLDNCATLKPLPWATLGQQFLGAPSRLLCVGKCS